jgi:hypothetical protein
MTERIDACHFWRYIPEKSAGSLTSWANYPCRRYFLPTFGKLSTDEQQPSSERRWPDGLRPELMDTTVEEDS